MRPPRHDKTRRISLHRGGTQGVTPRVPSAPPITATGLKTYPRPDSRPLTQIPPGGGRRAPFPGEWAPPAAGGRRLPANPSPRPTPRGLEAGGAPPQKKKELAALNKSWTNFSGNDGCGRGEWDWRVAPTPPAPRRRNLGSGGAPQHPASRPHEAGRPTPREAKGAKPPCTHKKCP